MDATRTGCFCPKKMARCEPRPRRPGAGWDGAFEGPPSSRWRPETVARRFWDGAQVENGVLDLRAAKRRYKDSEPQADRFVPKGGAGGAGARRRRRSPHSQRRARSLARSVAVAATLLTRGYGCSRPAFEVETRLEVLRRAPASEGREEKEEKRKRARSGNGSKNKFRGPQRQARERGQANSGHWRFLIPFWSRPPASVRPDVVFGWTELVRRPSSPQVAALLVDEGKPATFTPDHRGR